MENDDLEPRVSRHHLLAEQGKRLALEKQYVQALELYREALQQAQLCKAPSIVMRHYTECILEALELMGSYHEVIAYCDEAIRHYELNPPESQIAKYDLAAIYQRQSLVYAKLNQWSPAQESASYGRGIARELGVDMPLLEKMFNWLASRLYLKVERIEKEQWKAGYFSVRSDTVV